MPVGGPKDPETVAIAGDWHTSTAWAQHAISMVAEPGATVIVHVGDFGYTTTAASRLFLDTIEETLRETGLLLLWVDGNHDDTAALNQQPLTGGVHRIRDHIVHLPRGFRWNWHERTWLALGGAVSIDREEDAAGTSWWPTEEITPADIAAATIGGRAEVMICHDAPTGVEKLARHLGAPPEPADVATAVRASQDAVRAVVDAVTPDLLVHGHHHWRYSDRLGGTRIEGLDRDGRRMARNLILVDARTLRVRNLFS